MINEMSAALERAGLTGNSLRPFLSAVYDEHLTLQEQPESLPHVEQQNSNLERRKPMTDTNRQVVIQDPDAPSTFRQRIAIITAYKANSGLKVAPDAPELKAMTKQQASDLIDKLKSKGGAQPSSSNGSVADLLASVAAPASK